MSWMVKIVKLGVRLQKLMEKLSRQMLTMKKKLFKSTKYLNADSNLLILVISQQLNQ